MRSKEKDENDLVENDSTSFGRYSGPPTNYDKGAIFQLYSYLIH